MTLAAHIDAILDAAVAWRLETLRQPGERSIYWQNRWRGKIERALDALPAMLDAATAYRLYAQMLTVIALEYPDFRHPVLAWRRGRVALEAMPPEGAKRTWLVETHFPRA